MTKAAHIKKACYLICLDNPKKHTNMRSPSSRECPLTSVWQRQLVDLLIGQTLSLCEKYAFVSAKRLGTNDTFRKPFGVWQKR